MCFFVTGHFEALRQSQKIVARGVKFEVTHLFTAKGFIDKTRWLIVFPNFYN